jgi:hypothetical protein
MRCLTISSISVACGQISSCNESAIDRRKEEWLENIPSLEKIAVSQEGVEI